MQTPSSTNDPVHRPAHYTAGGIEVIDFINAWDMSFLQGNVIKYVTRYQLKGGVEDLLKAQQYLTWLIEKERRAAMDGTILDIARAAVGVDHASR